jgi:sulfate permease, SulP family
MVSNSTAIVAVREVGTAKCSATALPKESEPATAKNPLMAHLVRRKTLKDLFRRDTIREDAIAGVVLGVESVPDGLAGGLLAGVNPVFGLYGYMFGTVSGALSTSSSFMAVQATGAMAIIIADVDLVHSGEDPNRALFTLSILTGALMILAGFFKLGSLLRFVSNAVMVGFISAVGANIVLGQLDNLTGYAAQGNNRVLRALDLLFHPLAVDFRTLLIGLVTIGLILVLERTRLGALGLVVAVITGSLLVVVLGWDVAQLLDIADVPSSLPLPQLPDPTLILQLALPAVALTFVGLVQGAAISASFPKADGTYPDVSQDFVGQGFGNVISGAFQGMPVGGSMSASSLTKAAGAKSRTALVIASMVMALVILIFGGVVGYIAMPSLAGLLIVVGFRTIKPLDIKTVWKIGSVQAMVMTVTLVLTMIIPLQQAVLVGVGISMILFIIRQSNQVTMKKLELGEGRIRETVPPVGLGRDEVVLLQPYGSLFFASAQTFEEQLPDVTRETHNSVVVIRLRGMSDPGSTLMEVLNRYGSELKGANSKLMLVSDQKRALSQFEVTGVTRTIGSDNIYESDEWVGETIRRAAEDAQRWVTGNSGENR